MDERQKSAGQLHREIRAAALELARRPDSERRRQLHRAIALLEGELARRLEERAARDDGGGKTWPELVAEALEARGIN